MMKPRVIITTDMGGDNDDKQSFVHALACQDAYDLEGVISSATDEVRPNRSVDRIHEMIDEYEKDWPILSTWPGYTLSPTILRAMTFQGHMVPQPGGFGEPNEASEHIIERAHIDDPRPLYLLAWGGCTDIVQALHDDPTIAPKIRIIDIYGQDTEALNYQDSAFPDVWTIRMQTTFRGMYFGGNQTGDLHATAFLQEHVKGHGHLAEFMPLDVFLTGYLGAVNGLKAGDTPSLLYVLDPNSDPDDPTAPSWGGMFQCPDPVNRPNFWTDIPGSTYREGSYNGAKTVNVHREAVLRDWQEKMDRFITPYSAGEPGVIVYHFERSPTGTGDWTRIASDLPDTEYNVDTTALANGAHYFSVIAEDTSDNTLSPRSNVRRIVVDNFANTAPTVEITAPGGGHTVVEGTPITFTCTATDAEDGALSGNAVVWSSSISGVLGTGTSLNTVLAVGTHTITCTVTDSGDLTATDTIIVTVNAFVNTPPTVTITSPSSNITVDEGQVVAFACTASDTDDGPLTGNSVVWTSSISGQLGTGTSLNLVLVPGVHIITVTVTDSGSLTATDSIEVTVEEFVNTPPVVTILNPEDGATINGLRPLILQATAVDAQEGVLTNLIWSSSKDGALGIGANVFLPGGLSVGEHTITCEATDSHDATGSDSVTIEAVEPPPRTTLVWLNPIVESTPVIRTNINSAVATNVPIDSTARYEMQVTLNEQRVGPMPQAPTLYLDNDDIFRVNSVRMLNPETYVPEVGTGLEGIEAFFSEENGLDAEPIGDWVLELEEQATAGNYAVAVEGVDKTELLSSYVGSTLYVIVKLGQLFRVVGQVRVEEVRTF